MPKTNNIKRAQISPTVAVTEDFVEVRAGETKNFSMIRQGTATNDFAKTVATSRNMTIDDITGTATIKRGSLTIAIPNYLALAGLKTSTAQLFDAIMIKFTESGAKSPTVTIPLSEYMERRGLKDRKEAKARAKEDMDTLRPISFTWEEKRGGKVEQYKFVNLADSGEIKRNGDIVFTFGATFCKVAKSYPVMPYPDQLQKLNSNKYPHSYAFLRKIAEHKNMNVGKDNEDIIAVQTLLDASPTLPTYEEVKRTDRAFSRRIQERFEKGMDALKETLTWEYCRSKGQPLSRDEVATDFSVFLSLLVHITWNDYPDQTARLERKAQRIEESKQKKGGSQQQRGRKKKATAAS